MPTIFLAVFLAGLTLAGACATVGPPSPALRTVSFVGMPMAALDDDTFVETTTPPPVRDRLRAMSDGASRRIEGFYGGRVGPRPLVIFCGTNPCRVHFTGPSKRSWSLSPGNGATGAKYVAGARHTIIVVRTDAHAEKVLTHELSHVELQARARPGRAPTWFDEGVATYVGGEQDCSTVTPTPMAHLAKLVDDDAWFAWTSKPGALIPAYCGARREVAAWVERNGVAQLHALLAGLRAGRSFETLYRRAPPALSERSPQLSERRSPARCRRSPACV